MLSNDPLTKRPRGKVWVKQGPVITMLIWDNISAHTYLGSLGSKIKTSAWRRSLSSCTYVLLSVKLSSLRWSFLWDVDDGLIFSDEFQNLISTFIKIALFFSFSAHNKTMSRSTIYLWYFLWIQGGTSTLRKPSPTPCWVSWSWRTVPQSGAVVCGAEPAPV